MRFRTVFPLGRLGIAVAAALLAPIVHPVPGFALPAAADSVAMAGHMTFTELRTPAVGDKQRADAIVIAARQAMAPYADFHQALADGYVIFHPEVKQRVYHFTRDDYGVAAWSHFDATKPTSLLYEKTSAAGEPDAYKLLGVMYTDRHDAPLEELNERVPLSVTRWHLHTNVCLPPRGQAIDSVAPEIKFGLRGSITTADACEAAGGRFLPHLFGWMVHVYPNETDPVKIWASGMDDEHGMQHDGMAGMASGSSPHATIPVKN